MQRFTVFLGQLLHRLRTSAWPDLQVLIEDFSDHRVINEIARFIGIGRTAIGINLLVGRNRHHTIIFKQGTR